MHLNPISPSMQYNHERLPVKPKREWNPEFHEEIEEIDFRQEENITGGSIPEPKIDPFNGSLKRKRRRRCPTRRKWATGALIMSIAVLSLSIVILFQTLSLSPDTKSAQYTLIKPFAAAFDLIKNISLIAAVVGIVSSLLVGFSFCCKRKLAIFNGCLLYTSDAADE